MSTDLRTRSRFQLATTATAQPPKGSGAAARSWGAAMTATPPPPSRPTWRQSRTTSRKYWSVGFGASAASCGCCRQTGCVCVCVRAGGPGESAIKQSQVNDISVHGQHSISIYQGHLPAHLRRAYSLCMFAGVSGGQGRVGRGGGDGGVEKSRTPPFSRWSCECTAAACSASTPTSSSTWPRSVSRASCRAGSSFGCTVPARVCTGLDLRFFVISEVYHDADEHLA